MEGDYQRNGWPRILWDFGYRTINYGYEPYSNPVNFGLKDSFSDVYEYFGGGPAQVVATIAGRMGPADEAAKTGACISARMPIFRRHIFRISNVH